MTAKTTTKEICPHCEGVGFFVRDGFEVRVCSVTGLVKSEQREVCPACEGVGLLKAPSTAKGSSESQKCRAHSDLPF